MITRTRLLLALLFFLALLLTQLGVPVASTQGVTVVAARVPGELPMRDPGAALWQEATAVEVPLSAQNVARPMLPETRVKSVTVRALYNDAQLAFLVEWDDETQDDASVRIQDFTDAVALQFPMVQNQPFFCMGQQGGDVNIWHWKADWQAELAGRQNVTTAYPNMATDYYHYSDREAAIAGASQPGFVTARDVGNAMARAEITNPVEDLIAGGFGTLTAQPEEGQNVEGFGEWEDGRWRVVFNRELQSPDGDDVSFDDNTVYSLAFAAWDGANEERNGQKSTSQWISLQLGEPLAAAGTEPGEPAAEPAPAGAREVLSLEALPYIFGPMLLLLLLTLAAAAAVFILGRLPD